MKYFNKPVYTDEGKFDSQREYRRWQELKLMERAGEIKFLRRQVPFKLIPTQRDPETGAILERECKYWADFVYETKDGAVVVEDAKGEPTKDYIIKRKLMLQVHGIRIQEV